jgi:hypothetical protein
VSITFSDNHAVYETMWIKIVEADTPKMTIWCTRTACWITKATDTYSEYVILPAFPQQQWFCECTSMLHYMCNAFLVLNLSDKRNMISPSKIAELTTQKTVQWTPSLLEIK